MAENKNILEVHHLKKSFTTGKKSFTAVEDVSFSLKTGEVLGIVGESGSGKSTVAKMITHLTEPGQESCTRSLDMRKQGL